MAASCVAYQGDGFLDNMRAQLNCYKEEATMLLSKLGLQEECGGNSDRKRIWNLISLLDMENGFRMNSSKLCSQIVIK